MAEKNNSICCICGTPYHLCISCAEHKNINPWKIYTDTSEHYKIFQILHGVTVGVYTKDEAKEKFKNVDLSDLENLRDDIKATIKDIIGIDKKKKISKSVETE